MNSSASSIFDVTTPQDQHSFGDLPPPDGPPFTTTIERVEDLSPPSMALQTIPTPRTFQTVEVTDFDLRLIALDRAIAYLSTKLFRDINDADAVEMAHRFEAYLLAVSDIDME